MRHLVKNPNTGELEIHQGIKSDVENLGEVVHSSWSEKQLIEFQRRLIAEEQFISQTVWIEETLEKEDPSQPSPEPPEPPEPSEPPVEQKYLKTYSKKSPLVENSLGKSKILTIIEVIDVEDTESSESPTKVQEIGVEDIGRSDLLAEIEEIDEEKEFQPLLNQSTLNTAPKDSQSENPILPNDDVCDATCLKEEIEIFYEDIQIKLESDDPEYSDDSINEKIISSVAVQDHTNDEKVDNIPAVVPLLKKENVPIPLDINFCKLEKESHSLEEQFREIQAGKTPLYKNATKKTLTSLSKFLKSKGNKRKLTIDDLEEFCKERKCKVIVCNKSDKSDFVNQIKMQKEITNKANTKSSQIWQVETKNNNAPKANRKQDPKNFQTSSMLTNCKKLLKRAFILPAPTLYGSKIDNNIVLAWHMPSDFTYFDKLASYQIFGCILSDRKNCALKWNKVCELTASGSSMKCTFKNIHSESKYYFSVRGIDINKTEGYFSSAVTIDNSYVIGKNKI